MNTKIYVDNLAATTTERELVDLFSVYGKVVEVNIALDSTSHKPRGFGFVTMMTPEGARAAIQGLNRKATGTTGTLAVSDAWPNKERASGRNRRGSPRRRSSHLF